MDRIDKIELINRVSSKISEDTSIVEKIIDATLEEIYEALKQEECVSLRNFGTFYVKQKRNTCVFKFNPAQRLRKLFGWASSYKGEL